MNVKSILCPVDFSSTSNVALNVASQFAREQHAKLFIVHVEEAAAMVEPGLFAGVPNVAWTNKYRLSQTLPTATRVKFEHALLFGDPATEIVEFAKENKVDLIVLGTHGATGLRRLLMGSVAEGVVRRATVPVMTVKERVPNPVVA